jgi:hypothetical protein
LLDLRRDLLALVRESLLGEARQLSVDSLTIWLRKNRQVSLPPRVHVPFHTGAALHEIGEGLGVI